MSQHHRRIRSRVAALLTVLVLPLALLTGLSSSAQAAGTLTATFSIQDNGSWWKGTYTIHNSGSAAVNGWQLEFDLPAGTTTNGHYYGDATVTGNHVSVKNAHYNGTIPAGGSSDPFSYWFIGNGPAKAPTTCTINGDKCDGTPDVPPTAPGTPKVTTATARSIALSWPASSAGDYPVKSYEVVSDGKTVATSDTNSATITGLTPATSYTFAVRAKDRRDNLSPLSAPVTATTVDPASDPTPPTAPGNLRSTAKTSSTVTLAWEKATDNVGVAAYDVYEGGKLAKTVAADTTTATISGLSPVTEYSFTVKARDAAENSSPASNTVKVTTDDLAGEGQHLNVGYFVQWGIYGRQYFVKNLDTSGAAAKLDVINYAFENLDPKNLTCMAGVTKGTTTNPQDPDQGTGAGDADADYGRPMSAAQSVDGVADDGWGKLRGNFNQIKKLKAKHPHLKVLVSLGGWTFSKFFSDAAATPESREKFVKSCVDVWIKGNLPAYNGAGGPGTGAGVFDGVDVDWEWPGSPDGGHPGNHYNVKDKENLTALLAEFRKQLDATGGERKLLTAFTPADPVKIDQGWDLSKIFNYLDFANVQGYDFHGSGSDNSWEPNRTGHQGNLFTDTDDPYPTHFSIEEALKPYTDAGVNPRKLTMGFPFYGRGWQGVEEGGKKGEWQSAKGAAPGQFAEEAGIRGYQNMLSSVPNMTIHHDEQSISTYGYTGPGGQWWSFDDEWSIAKKTAWMKQKNLLGAMIWEMSGDTPNGSLMNAIDKGLK